MNQVLDERTASAEAFMRRILRDDQPLASEYPLVFHERFEGQVVALQEGEQLRSACGIIAREFITPKGSLRGGLIGSVVTDPDRRTSGLATRVLIEAEAALQAGGCAFALLWAEDPDFYLRRGYGPVAREIDLVISYDLIQQLPEASHARCMTELDLESIHGLYAAHQVRIERTLEETRALFECPNMTTLVLEEHGQVVGYACMGRGKDLKDAIHEWGGSAEHVLALVRAHLERRFTTADEADTRFLFLMAPPSAVELVERLVALGAPASESMLGLGKILDREAAAACVTAVLAPAGHAEVLTGEGQAGFRVQGPAAQTEIDDEGMLAILLGVNDVHGDVEQFFHCLGFGDVALPIDPFAWGLDSI